METSHTIWFSTKTGTNGTIPQLTHHGSSQKRQHAHLSIPALLVARDDHLGGTVHSRMCTLPTEQNTYHQEKDPPLSHPRGSVDAPIQCHCPGSYHPAAQSKQIWCNSHHSRPGMLQSCYFPPMSYEHHQRGSGPLVPQASVPMVQSPLKGNLQPRSSIHIPLCTSFDNKAKHRVKY